MAGRSHHGSLAFRKLPKASTWREQGGRRARCGVARPSQALGHGLLSPLHVLFDLEKSCSGSIVSSHVLTLLVGLNSLKWSCFPKARLWAVPSALRGSLFCQRSNSSLSCLRGPFPSGLSPPHPAAQLLPTPPVVCLCLSTPRGQHAGLGLSRGWVTLPWCLPNNRQMMSSAQRGQAEMLRDPEGSCEPWLWSSSSSPKPVMSFLQRWTNPWPVGKRVRK